MDFYAILLRIVHNGVDLTPRQLCVLWNCNERSQTVRELAERLNISKPAISRAADRLEESGFIERDDDPKDRRSVLLSLTAAGKTFMTNLQQVAE